MFIISLLCKITSTKWNSARMFHNGACLSSVLAGNSQSLQVPEGKAGTSKVCSVTLRSSSDRRGACVVPVPLFCTVPKLNTSVSNCPCDLMVDDALVLQWLLISALREVRRKSPVTSLLKRY